MPPVALAHRPSNKVLLLLRQALARPRRRVGWTLAIGRTGSIAGPAAGGWLLQTGLGMPDLFVLASVFPLLCVLGVALSLRCLAPAADAPPAPFAESARSR